MGSNDNDDQLSDTNDRNWVSESVFLEGTESVANVLFFAGEGVAASIARPVNSHGTSNRPVVENTHNSTAGITSHVRTIDTSRLTAQNPSSSVTATSFTWTVSNNQSIAQNPQTGDDMNSVDHVSDDVVPKPSANIPPSRPDSSFGISNSSGDNMATSQKSQISDAVRALEDRVHRDICHDHLNMPWCGQNYGTTPNTVTQQPGNIPTKRSILGWFSESLRYVFGVPWTYIPLPSPSHIRLLAIQPGVNDDILVASFEILDLNEADSRYEAVSYQWSEGGHKASIYLGGEKIFINGYLRRILLHLRLKQHVRILWADAICINQADHAERLQQVSIMQRIYSQAFRVIGFVGKDYLHAGTCFSAIEALTGSWFNARKSFSQDTSISSTPGRVNRSDEAAMSRIVEIFRSGYWKRLWVVQELVSSRRAIIRWGDAEISWTLLGLATTLIRNDQRLMTMFKRISKSNPSTSAFKGNPDARTGLMNAYLMYRMPSAEFRSDSMSFLDVLRLTRNFDVSERLDRIYAILGLPSQHTGPGCNSIPPDYRLLPIGLYSRVFYWVFKTHEVPLEILSAVRHTTLLYPDYPTWIPQWHVKPIRSIGGSHRAGMKFDASAGWNPKPPAKLAWESNERHLILQGFVLGAVTSSYRVFPQMNANYTRACHKEMVAHNAELNGWLHQNVSSHNDINKQLPLVLTAGQDWYGNILKERAAISEHTESFEKWKHEYFQNKVPHHGDAGRYGQAMGNVCDERRLFTVTNRLLGLGPNLLRKEDVVCVVAGGPVPYILRPLGDDTFYFVGECYVTGYMFGEAVVDWRSQTPTSFTLRQFTLK